MPNLHNPEMANPDSPPLRGHTTEVEDTHHVPMYTTSRQGSACMDIDATEQAEDISSPLRQGTRERVSTRGRVYTTHMGPPERGI